MTNEKMTVHKALSELKTLDSRIEKAMNSVSFVFANKHGNGTVKGITVAAYTAEIKSAYQSVTDLMARRNAIKRAVTLSNATQKVTIGGNEYTVAEAIEFKNHAIPLMKSLLNKLAKDDAVARGIATNNNGDVLETRADDYVRSLYGNTDMKNASEEIKKVRADFIAAQTMEIVDPIGISQETKALEEKINGFVVDVDSALSVSNALTEIDISY